MPQAVHHDVLRGRRLQPGDRVRLVSPSSFPSHEWLAESVRILRSWGLHVEVGDHALDQRGFMAGRDEDRLADLNDAFRDHGVRAIIASRGGAGAYRIVDGIDFKAVRADPKPVVGFSDITNLHLALWQQCRLACVHGCLSGARAVTSLRQLLMTTQPITLKRDPQLASAAIEFPGQVTGVLVGGHLRTIVGFVGTGIPSFDGAILCFEENEDVAQAGALDRILHHLLSSGMLDGVRGIAIGQMAVLDAASGNSAPERCRATEVLRDRLGGLGVPVLGGLPFGHLPDQSCVPLGTTATIDTTAGTLTVTPAVV